MYQDYTGWCTPFMKIILWDLCREHIINRKFKVKSLDCSLFYFIHLVLLVGFELRIFWWHVRFLIYFVLSHLFFSYNSIYMKKHIINYLLLPDSYTFSISICFIFAVKQIRKPFQNKVFNKYHCSRYNFTLFNWKLEFLKRIFWGKYRNSMIIVYEKKI